jgi:hypothetical protein
MPNVVIHLHRVAATSKQLQKDAIPTTNSVALVVVQMSQLMGIW